MLIKTLSLFVVHSDIIKSFINNYNHKISAWCIEPHIFQWFHDGMFIDDEPIAAKTFRSLFILKWDGNVGN